MTEKKKGELVELFKRSSEQGPGAGQAVNITGNGNQIAGRDIINTERIVTRQKITITPGHEVITEAQAVTIRTLVAEIADLEKKLKRSPKSYAAIQAAANKKGGVTQYRLIPLERFPVVEKYLRQWIGRLTAQKSAPAKTGDDWRKRKYAFIKVNAKQFNLDERLARFLWEHCQAVSLTELTDDDLQRVYLAVSRWKAGKS